MTKHNYKYYFLLYSILILLSINSCTPEKKLGKDFLKEVPEISMEVYTPENLFKFNHKGETIEGFDSLTATQQDSVLYATSHYMRFIDDSVFMDHYVNSFLDELRSLGFRVFLDNNADTALRSLPQVYVVNISQVQLDEYYQPFEDSDEVGDTTFYKSFNLNAVDLSSWFELNKYNVAKPVRKVLYSSFTGSDGFSGNFMVNPFTMDIRYRYKIDSLKVKDIYDLAGFSGRRNADYLFDYFMNQFIARNMPKDIAVEGYLRYSPASKSFSFTEDEKFEVLKTK